MLLIVRFKITYLLVILRKMGCELFIWEKTLFIPTIMVLFLTYLSVILSRKLLEKDKLKLKYKFLSYSISIFLTILALIMVYMVSKLCF